MSNVWALIGVAAYIAASTLITMLSHRIIYGRWRGAPAMSKRRGYVSAAIVIAMWMGFLATVAFARPRQIALVLIVSMPVVLSILLGCVERYGEHL